MPEWESHRTHPIIADLGAEYGRPRSRWMPVLTIVSQRSIPFPIRSFCTPSPFSSSINILWASSVIWWRKLQLADYLSWAHFFHFLWSRVASKQRKLIIYFYQEGYSVRKSPRATEMHWDGSLTWGEVSGEALIGHRSAQGSRAWTEHRVSDPQMLL